jgi:hypothetical protein
MIWMDESGPGTIELWANVFHQPLILSRFKENSLALKKIKKLKNKIKKTIIIKYHKEQMVKEKLGNQS